MQVQSILSSPLRRTLRIITILLIFFFILSSVSRYHGSFEFSIDDDGQVQSVRNDHVQLDVHHTHHVATFDPNDIKPWTQWDTEALRTVEGQEVVQYLTASSFKQLTPENNDPHLLKDDFFAVLTKRLRVYRALWHSLKGYYDQLATEGRQDHLYDEPPTEIAPAVELLQKLEQTTFPWIWKHHKTSFDFYSEYKNGGRGIVMCVGNGHTKYARTAVKTLREVVKSKLPIEIYYIGEFDLSSDNRAWFEQFEDVKTIDIRTVIDDSMLKLEGWA
ncbi:hypothetical protein BGZ65_010230, partial [Modicella reniformis]